MKTDLKISMLVNAALIGCLIFVEVDRPTPVSKPVPSTVFETRLQTADTSSPENQTSSDVEPAPFSWRQLESADYRIYIKNLRGIGCPEATIQAIVTADVHKLYNAKYQQLEQKLAALDNAPLPTHLASYQEQQALETELQKLPGEETSMALDLQAQESPPASRQVASAQVAPRMSAASQSTKPPVLPLVFQNVDLAQLNLNDEQVQAITDLRNTFVEQIGGPNQNPSDPAYLQNWQLSQPEIDNILKGYLGINKYMQYQVMVANE